MRSITLLLGTLLLAACGGTPIVDGTKVADETSKQLAEVVGRAPDKVTCPDLTAEVGAKVRCVLEDSGTKYGVDVTVTGVDGKDVAFGVKVDDTPMSE